ncbi:uncharacterized protein LOC143031004 isoform X2 [Oratosquilla oratoria]|uniref:uncharacterized protein LOC143031004 isoform X2 n=1 Tax=Oratosquilla oratoria TaxID=337810 RepID=UPI003F76041F
MDQDSAWGLATGDPQGWRRRDLSSATNVEGVPRVPHESSMQAGEERSYVPGGPEGFVGGEMKTMPPEHNAFSWPQEPVGARQDLGAETNPETSSTQNPAEAETDPEANKDTGATEENAEGENGLVKERVLHTSSNEYRLKAGMSPAGRKRDPVWVLFERIQWGQYHRAKCKSCLKEVQGIPLRMKRHLEICSMSPNTPEKGRANIDPRKKFLQHMGGGSGNEQDINPESLLESSMSVGEGSVDKDSQGGKTADEHRGSSGSSSSKDESSDATGGARDRYPLRASSNEGGSGLDSSTDPKSRGENGIAGGPEQQRPANVANGPVPRRNLGMSPGRKKDPIWFSFERTKKGKGHRARCKNCNKEIQGIVHRMKRHLQLCTMSLSPLGKVLGSPVLTVGTSSSTWFMAASSAPIGNRSSSQSDGEKAPWEETGEATMLIDRDIVCTCGRNFNDCGTGHPRCRGHSDCFQEGRYLARACDVCRYIWFLADTEGPLQTSAINALRLWKRGFQKNTRHRNKNVDIFVDPVERREFERIVAPYPRHIKVTDPALLALMKGTSSSGPGHSRWSSKTTTPSVDAAAEASVDSPMETCEDSQVSSQDEYQPTPAPTEKKEKSHRRSGSTQQHLGSLEEGVNSVQETLRSLMEVLSDRHDSNNDSHSDNDSHPDDDSNADDDDSQADDDDSHADEESNPDEDSQQDADLQEFASSSNLQPDGSSHASAQGLKSSDESHSPSNDAPTTSDYGERTSDGHPMSDLPLEPETIIQEVYGDESYEDDKYKWHPAAGKIRLTADGTVVFPSGNIATKDQVEIQYEGGEVWYRWKPSSEDPPALNIPTYMGKARQEARAAFKEYCDRLFNPHNRVEEPEPEPQPPPPPPPPPKNPADFSPLSFTAACLKDATANFATVIRTGKYVHEETSLFASVIIHGPNTSAFIQEAKDIFHGKNLDPEVTSHKLQLQVLSVDNQLLDSEFQSRKQLWNAISSLAMMEGTAKAAADGKNVTTYNTLAKTALPNLCNDITQFFLAKFEVRKAYLSVFDNRNPHYFALMYSSPWCPDLFPDAVMNNLVRQAEAHCKPVSKMLGKSCSRPVKKRSAAPQVSSTPDQKARLSEATPREPASYPYKPGRDYRSQQEFIQEPSRQTTEYPQDQPPPRGDEHLALFGGSHFKPPSLVQPSPVVDPSLSGNLGPGGANGSFYAPPKEWDGGRSMPHHYTNPSSSS